MGQFESEWIDSNIIPLLLPLAKHRNYLRRMTLLSALSSTCSTVSFSALRAQYLPMLEHMATDPIANVRLNVAKTIQVMVPVMVAATTHKSNVRETLNNVIIPILQQMQRDADVDVHDSATQALDIIPVF